MRCELLRGNFPTVVILTTGKVHDVNILDELAYEPGSFYIADRGYLDFARLYRLHLCGAFFMTRAKKTPAFSGVTPAQSTNPPVCVSRRIGFRDPKTGKALVFLTNNFTEPALTIAQLYRCRWQANCFSDGSNSICVSRRFTGLRRMRSASKSGSPSPCMSWLPSSKSGCASRPARTQFYRF